ncbi:MAG: hypothetical protein LBN29_03340 [Mediterranea sp.]|jgi:hypothetical protein|nr:hypothetical protein [Mediterranea sp.]
MGNPINNVDLQGDSITVLNLGSGTNQHMALLIQNEAGKWQYFSVNGNNVFFSGNHTGGRPFDDISVVDENGNPLLFDTPQQFLDSYYNSDGDKNDPSINSYGYTEGYVIPTSQEQDGVIRNTFIDISQNTEYDLLGNNCSTAVQKSMEAVGLKTYDDAIRTYRVPANQRYGESGFTATSKNSRPIIPSVSFKSIRQYNPQGIYVQKRR